MRRNILQKTLIALVTISFSVFLVPITTLAIDKKTKENAVFAQKETACKNIPVADSKILASTLNHDYVSYNSQSDKIDPIFDQEEDPTVYITKSGKCYHRKSCIYLKKSCIEIKLSVAKKNKYKPCSKCKPPL